MPTSEQLHAYHRVEDDTSVFIHEITMLHGPMDIVNDDGTFNSTKCLACNVIWPCRTFEILADRRIVKVEKPVEKAPKTRHELQFDGWCRTHRSWGCQYRVRDF